jgi:uncharacterized membrane protein YhdT
MSSQKQDHRSEDPVARATAKTTTLAKRKLKRYGLLTLVNIVAFVFISYGMPGHALWPMLAIPLFVSFACFFAPTLFYGAMLVGEWLDKKRYPQC